jgi:hypothetical protein
MIGFAPEQTNRLHVKVLDRLTLLVWLLSLAAERAAVAEIGTRAEGFALRREHDGAAVVPLVERFQHTGDFFD